MNSGYSADLEGLDNGLRNSEITETYYFDKLAGLLEALQVDYEIAVINRQERDLNVSNILRRAPHLAPEPLLRTPSANTELRRTSSAERILNNRAR